MELAPAAGAAPSPVTNQSLLWQAKVTRAFDVPPRLSDTRFECGWENGAANPICQQPFAQTAVRPSNTGTYQPFLYVLPGAFMRLADSPSAALRVGRVVSALLAGLLLCAAIAMAWSREVGPASLLGVLTATTPMVIFVASSLSASGPEVIAAIAFAAAALRVARDAERTSVGVWYVLGVSGSVLALGRALGPLFVVVILLTVAAFSPATVRRAVQKSRTRVLATAGVLATATAAGLGWELSQQPHATSTFSSLWAAVRPAIDDLPSVLRQSIGNFGALDTPLPGFAWQLWLVAFAALVTAALAMANRRQRIVLVAVVAMILIVSIAATVQQRQTGFGLQGRHVLPLLILLPLLASEILVRARPLPRHVVRALAIGLPVIVAVVQAVGWYTNARYVALGADPGWTISGNARWAPPLGWGFWAVVVASAAAAIGSVGFSSSGPLSREKTPTEKPGADVSAKPAR